MSVYFKRNNRVNETSSSGDKISQKTVENFVSSASALSEGIHCLLKIVESHFSRSFMRLMDYVKLYLLTAAFQFYLFWVQPNAFI